MSAKKPAGGGSASKAKAPVQSNSMFSYFTKKEAPAGSAPAAAAATAAAAAKPSPARAASLNTTTSAPVAPCTPPRPSATGASAGSTPLTPEQKARIEANRAAAAAKLAAAGASSNAVAASFFGGVAAPAPAPRTPAPAPRTPAPALPTPPRAQAAAAAAVASPSPAMELSSSGRKRKVISYTEDDDEQDESSAPAPRSAAKKGRKAADDEDYTGGAAASDDGMSSAHDDDDDDDGAAEEEEEEERKTPARKRAPSSASKKSAAPSSASKKTAKKAAAASDDDGDEDEAQPRGGKEYSTPFLDPANRRDINKRRPGDKGYDPTTLYIPPECWSKFTPAERQYWEHKQVNCDLVLFFKIGKFYELFDDDADVGVKELGLQYMVNKQRPHCGFPEAALHKYAERLVALGYKIGQVDQTETPEMLKIANAALGKGQKKRACVMRELSEVITPGTIVESDVLGSADANYLFAMVERELSAEEIEAEERQAREATTASASASSVKLESALDEEANLFVVEYGFAYVDATTGKFVLGQRRDDKQRSFLKTLLGQVAPRETVLPRDGLSKDTQHVMKLELPVGVCKNEITPGTEFWDSKRMLAEFDKKDYFGARRAKLAPPAAGDAANPRRHWPLALQQTLSKGQHLALSALGAITFYLRRSLHDHELISLANFTNYHDHADMKQNLVLDGQTLSNLEIVKNQEGSLKGTLLEFADRCVTAFGKRKLRTWVTAPLYSISAITQRQDAVAYWMEHPDVADKLRNDLRKLPDLERSLSRIHAHGLKREMRVIMYEDVSLKKLEMFLKTLEGFDAAQRVFDTMARQINDPDSDEAGERLRAMIAPTSEGGLLPPFVDAIHSVRTKFDVEAARRTKKIFPFPGLNQEYDETCARLRELTSSCDDYLRELRALFGDSNIKWSHKGKERFQIEVPVSALAKKPMPPGFDLMSSTKNIKRFWTARSKKLSAAIQEAELVKEEMEKDASRLVFASFAEQYAVWIGTVELLAELDCLLSLALVSKNHAGCVRPEFVSFESNGGHAMLELRQASHPALYETANVNGLKPGTDNAFIANDVFMGVPDENPARFVLVSGPNMGGKSTLLRQTCCAVILAQVGCWIPAESCRMTPVDRIFTRVGAFDKIMQGKSTFLVELQETSVILKNATSRSLVILDELGRGTSTFDGTAIAHSVIKYLSESVDCLALFSTHYHMLLDEFASSPRISMYHMACHVDPVANEVTYLYKFMRGIANKSYGGNVALAAGLPPHIIQRANEMSESFEKRCMEAMGNKRATLSATFPQQKSGSKSLQLPPHTQRAIVAAVKAKDWPLVLRLKEAFDLAQRQHKEADSVPLVKNEMQVA